jgi:hypothetical protein
MGNGRIVNRNVAMDRQLSVVPNLYQAGFSYVLGVIFGVT